MSCTHHAPRRSTGFSLIELMIAVAIVGILARIAIPSYRNYLIRANRADAQQVLLQAAQKAERYYVANNGYTSMTTSSIGFSQSPQSPSTAIYNLSVSGTPTATSFVLLATPVDTGPNRLDGCLRIDSTGKKDWNGSGTTTGCGSTFGKAWTDR